MAMNVIDRRLNPSGKSLPNRQRFMRLAKETIKEAVVRSIRERTLGDVEGKEVVSIPMKRIAEPRLRHAARGGDRDQVFPGNKEFVQGDTLPKPKSGAGEKGSEGAPEGEGEDDFRFTLSADEYLNVLFEELELPDLAKEQLKDAATFRYQRAGHSSSGSPTNLNLVRTMRKSLARRICLGRPRPADVAALEQEIAALEACPDRTRRTGRAAGGVEGSPRRTRRARAANRLHRPGRPEVQPLRDQAPADRPGGDVLPDGRVGLHDRGDEGSRQAILPAAAPLPHAQLRARGPRLHPPHVRGPRGRRGNLLQQPRDRRHGRLHRAGRDARASSTPAIRSTRGTSTPPRRRTATTTAPTVPPA